MKAKARWKRVTNGWTIDKFKQEGCPNCEGKGTVGEESAPSVCSCVTLAFRRQMAQLTAEGKLREVRQRVGTDDRVWLEYREMGVAEPIN